MASNEYYGHPQPPQANSNADAQSLRKCRATVPLRGGYQQGYPQQGYPYQQPMQYQQGPPPEDSRGKKGGSKNCFMACIAALCCCCVAEEACECW
ncbi:transposase [Purpureocillium lavendulum]|uniref:Transposase n=1 Tax=Purpureocillium lavendulum TaxID=1247861 RepID=A0AB34FCW9_9HYPO|nr:transposase [Purpureocillium lavendulum]